MTPQDTKMGSIDSSRHSLAYQDSCNGLSVFEIQSSGSEHPSTASSYDVLLLSWLLVLLRTREDGRASFEWSFRCQKENEYQTPNTHLSTDDVLTDSQLHGSFAQAIERVSRHIKTNAPRLHTAKHNETSIIVSTASLSHDIDTNDNQVSMMSSTVISLYQELTESQNSLVHLDLQLYDGHLYIRQAWRSEKALPYTIVRYNETLAEMVNLCVQNPEGILLECLKPGKHDLDWIWKWNNELPPLLEYCMHEVIEDQASQHPGKVAIDAWNGTLTYGQVEQYSTQVALALRDSGVQHHDFVPVCFEKSKWTVVAVLAVMKVGATIMMADPSLPIARLQNMAGQISARVIVSSRDQCNLAATILPEGRHLIVEADMFAQPTKPGTTEELSPVPPTALMYIIFTSGSTGTPKGVKISHQTYTSSAIPRARAVGYNEESRVLDFASYAFDVSIDSMLLTLGNGGCLCIPSDEDRLGDINGVIRDMKINYAGITPSVARILDQDIIASMSALGLGGEAAAPRDVNLWGKETRIVIGYGPCECTIGCTVNSSAASSRDYISIGPGNGAAIWIVDPNDHEILLPVGAVGELLVEGPIVGQGYLNDPEKTASVFIHDPSWLVAGHHHHHGRRGRLYKTGDLGMYDPDGSGEIVFVGRKDTQVKLRGQRVELGEIESQLKARLPPDANVIAEVIMPPGSRGNPVLVAFVAPHSSKVNEDAQLESIRLPAELDDRISRINEDLGKVLPRYMVPNVYIHVNFIPSLISGKTDRKRLRQLGATLDFRQLDQPKQSTPVTADRELTDIEKILRNAWSQVLNMEESAIRPSDNFFALGGDSLAAMRLVSKCRENSYSLSVINAISNPTLADMASFVLPSEADVLYEVSPFSLLSRSAEVASLEASEACGVDPEAVEDIYPCTPTQESLITFSLKATEPYVAQRVACIPTSTNVHDLQQAWSQVVRENPILRSRVAQLQDPGLQQVVIREDIRWRYSTDLARYLEDDKRENMALGHNLARYAIIRDEKDGKTYMVWTVHHVLYDGWSEPLILYMVQNALRRLDNGVQSISQMRNFVKFVRDTDKAAMQDFWRQELDGAGGPQFPRLPSRDFLPKPDSLIDHQIDLASTEGLPFTAATLIRGAWALVASQHSGSNDVVFGETLTGRDVPVPDVENILGPLIATVPIRVVVDRKATVKSYLQAIQQASSARAAYQHMGMQYIRRVSEDAQRACEAPTGLVIQPEAEDVGFADIGFSQGDSVLEALHFNPYPLMLAFGLRKGGFRVCANFDSRIVTVETMDRVLRQLEAACLELTKDLTRRAEQVSCLPRDDLATIWRWNKTPPLSHDSVTGKFRANFLVEQGGEYPRVAVPWVCDPYNPELLSPIGCPGELWLEGHLLSGETVQDPSWLLDGSKEQNGRRGQVQSTGDIVQLNPDGSLTYVGRKEALISGQGHAVDIMELERHIPEVCSSSRLAAVVPLPLVEGDQAAKHPDVIVVLENGPLDSINLELMFMRHEIMAGDTEEEASSMTLCSEIPASLADGLKELDKFARDNLPSTLTPFAYVVVDKIPQQDGRIDRDLLQQLVAKIPRHVFDQLRAGLGTAWETRLATTDLSLAESILRSAWAKLLDIPPEHIELDDNFFRLGGDSVMAMRLVSGLRAQGHALSVADIFQNMRLRDAARVMKLKQVVETTVAYRPFFTLGALDVDGFLAEHVRPKLAVPNWVVKDVCLVTDIQAMDVRGTIQIPRTSVQYTMLYFAGDVDREQLMRAFTELVKTHDILRTVFVEHEAAFLQVVINDMDISIESRVAEGSLEDFVSELCESDIETDFLLGSPFPRVFSVEGKDGQHCLVLGLSHAQYDGISLPRLLDDLATLYSGEQVTDFLHFPAYIAHTQDEQKRAKALDYWRGVLENSSPTVLDPRRTTSQSNERGIFKETIAVENFEPVEEITTANLVVAAWALVLARRTGRSDVTFGVVASGRGLDMAGAEHVVGPCYRFSPVRVPVIVSDRRWTALDLLRFVQAQAARSAAHDFVGLAAIRGWVDSVVHHQDWDDADSMDFAGRVVRLQIAKPHGDAACPLKVVSFVKQGGLHVGIVGRGEDVLFVEEVLAELVGVVRELAGDPLGRICLGNEEVQV